VCRDLTVEDDVADPGHRSRRQGGEQGAVGGLMSDAAWIEVLGIDDAHPLTPHAVVLLARHHLGEQRSGGPVVAGHEALCRAQQP